MPRKPRGATGIDPTACLCSGFAGVGDHRMQLEVEAPGGALPPAAASQETTTAYVAFTRRKGLVGLLLKNAGLIVLSLSLYRFWARTALRRFFWSGISIAGDRLEYTGRG